MSGPAKFSEHCVGKIKSVYCKNFVTYNECTFYPTEYLNVIIGPNGTGKSTLVSAIILCLGGEPAALYRATDIRDYIKNGKTSSKIIVEICRTNRGESKAFRRSFDNTGKSIYEIDNEVVSRKRYLEAIAEYKIQVTNLCQFLPQDRVQDFAKMNPQEIFANTIKSVCSQESIDKFSELKQLQKEKVEGEASVGLNREKLKQASQRVEELRQTLDRFNARKEFEEKVKICNAKKLWMEVEEVEKKTADIKEDLKNATKSFNEKKALYEAEVQNEKRINERSERLQKDEKEKEMIIKQCVESLNKLTSQIEDWKKSISQAKINFEKDKREANEVQSEAQNEMRLLEVCTQDFKNAKTKYEQEKVEDKLKEIDLKMQEVKEKIARMVRERSDINKKLDEDYLAKIQMLKRNLERLENVKELKLQMLREKFPDVYTAVLWLRENKNLFEGHIYEPMILELNVRDPNNAKYFENSIQLRDLLAFTCEKKADVSRFTDEVCINKKLGINVLYSPPANDVNYRANEPIENLKQYGFTAYMLSLLEGPPALLNYLCSIYQLHRIPVGGDLVSKKSDVIPLHVKQYYGGNQRFIVSISKYSKEPSIMQTAIVGKKLLQSVDSSQVDYIKNELSSVLRKSDHFKNERGKIEAKINEIEFEYNEMRQTKRSLESCKIRLGQYKEAFVKQQQKVVRLKEQISNLKNLEPLFTSKVQGYLTKILDLQKAKVNSFKSLQAAIAKKQCSTALMNIFKLQNSDIIDRITSARSNFQEVQKLVNTITETLERQKSKQHNLMNEALKLTNRHKPSDRRFPYRQEFAELPNNIEELKEMKNEFIARLDCMGDVNAEIVQEFERKKVEVDTLKQKIEEFTNNENACLEKIQGIMNEWFPEIENILMVLNRSFGEFMSSMNYVGEVCLARNSEFDFESYGIQILVKYRECESLQPLDRSRQSGGERAVAIAVYSLSMQNITHVPFRCVDEINQGMDAKNERKIFEMLVEETTKTGRAQYFFVTPKLLPHLSYNDRMSVHIVFNGKGIAKNVFQSRA